jgi:hypothetical protein
MSMLRPQDLYIEDTVDVHLRVRAYRALRWAMTRAQRAVTDTNFFELSQAREDAYTAGRLARAAGVRAADLWEAMPQHYGPDEPAWVAPLWDALENGWVGP